jgi:hypothetical protein
MPNLNFSPTQRHSVLRTSRYLPFRQSISSFIWDCGTQTHIFTYCKCCKLKFIESGSGSMLFVEPDPNPGSAVQIRIFLWTKLENFTLKKTTSELLCSYRCSTPKLSWFFVGHLRPLDLPESGSGAGLVGSENSFKRKYSRHTGNCSLFSMLFKALTNE